METKINALENWLLSKTQDLIVAISKEEYEKASMINEDIDFKIAEAAKVLKKYGFPHEETRSELEGMKYSYIELWQEHLNIPGERRIKNI